MRNEDPKTRDWLLELVRAEDPLSNRVSPLTDAERETLLRRIRTLPFTRGAQRRWGIIVKPRPLIVAAVAVAAVIAGGVGVAFASGLLKDHAGVQAAHFVADSSSVTNVQTVASSSAGHANVVMGTQTGAAVASVTIGSFAGRFFSVAQALDGRDLEVQTGAGGSKGSVAWIAAAGLVSDRVAEVDLTSTSGAVMSVPVSSGAFAVEVNSAFDPEAIVAYDGDGNEVGREAIPAQQAPPQ